MTQDTPYSTNLVRQTRLRAANDGRRVAELTTADPVPGYEACKRGSRNARPCRRDRRLQMTESLASSSGDDDPLSDPLDDEHGRTHTAPVNKSFASVARYTEKRLKPFTPALRFGGRQTADVSCGTEALPLRLHRLRTYPTGLERRRGRSRLNSTVVAVPHRMPRPAFN